MVLSVKEEINMPKERIAAASKIKAKWANKATLKDIGGSAALKAIASYNNEGTIAMVKKITTANNLPNATTQLVRGEVASNSKVPRLRSSEYNPIDRIGRINKAKEPIKAKKELRKA